MIWTDDDTPIREKRKAGRPEVNPFPSSAVEEDFVVRGRKLIGLYWRDMGPQAKHNFFFDEQKHMSKTLLWSIIYIYYREQHGLRDNLQGFLATVQKHLGQEYSSDRASIAKKVGMLRHLYVAYKHISPDNLSRADQNAQNKYRGMYQYVTRVWDGLAEPS